VEIMVVMHQFHKLIENKKIKKIKRGKEERNSIMFYRQIFKNKHLSTNLLLLLLINKFLYL